MDGFGSLLRRRDDFSGPLSERRIVICFFLHPTRTDMPGTVTDMPGTVLASLSNRKASHEGASAWLSARLGAGRALLSRVEEFI